MLPLHPPAQVEVDADRHFIVVNDAACELLGYTREEFLRLRIDDISFPSGAHVYPLFEKFIGDGSMRGIFALRRKSGEGIMVTFESEIIDGRSVARWTHCAPLRETCETGSESVRLGGSGAEVVKRLL